ncbi:hypothetical protein K9B35_08560 [Sphingomonas sp. R647]|uniref:hypothetical protein n=1 Tax=Sphingomonas sp. R647 TaxID=2875233 RepID=UPI0010E308DD|nr:hypothetical protein [Sphingomonas sp. R647]MCA1198016.1 hypothetical protein [Sphingomonas sp. R647]RYD67833.1 MAG: hypothetical protein EOP58_02155 [Sphingomonadales bacterium]
MDQLNKRRIILAAGAAALLMTAATVHPTAEFEILTHELTDKTPRKFQAAVDTGVLAVSVIYTWTERSLR